MNFVYPDYHNCGLNVTSSIVKYFGAACAHPTRPALDALLAEKEYKHVVLGLIILGVVGAATFITLILRQQRRLVA